MSKPFNIHDWQDKQKRLSEQRADWTPPPMGMSPGDQKLTTTDNDWKGLSAEIAKYIGGTFASWMSPDNPQFHQDYAKAPYFDKLVGGIMDIVNDYEGEEDLDEANVTGTGTTISTGESPAYATPHAFGDDKEKKMKIYKSIGYKQIK